MGSEELPILQSLRYRNEFCVVGRWGLGVKFGIGTIGRRVGGALRWVFVGVGICGGRYELLGGGRAALGCGVALGDGERGVTDRPGAVARLGDRVAAGLLRTGGVGDGGLLSPVRSFGWRGYEKKDEPVQEGDEQGEDHFCQLRRGGPGRDVITHPADGVGERHDRRV